MVMAVGARQDLMVCRACRAMAKKAMAMVAVMWWDREERLRESRTAHKHILVFHSKKCAYRKIGAKTNPNCKFHHPPGRIHKPLCATPFRGGWL